MLLCYLILIFSNPNLLSRHYYFINARKSVPPPQYCIAVKIEFKLESLGSRLLSNSIKWLIFGLLSRGKDLVPQFNTRSGGGSDLHFSLRSLHILSKSLLLDLHPSPRLIPTLAAMVVDFGPAFLVSALVNIASALPFEVVLDHQ